MKTRFLIPCCIALALAGPAAAMAELEDESLFLLAADERSDDRAEREADRAEQEADHYEAGQDALDDEDWEEAVRKFGQVAAMGGPRTDGSLYWKAFALGQLGRTTDALILLAQLRKSHPNSRWLDDAKALELQVRQSKGRPVSPEAISDEELKLIALQHLLNHDSEKAVVQIERLLKGSASSKTKGRALFLLGQSDSPRAAALIAAIASGSANPDLQIDAVRFLAVIGGEKNRELLRQIYVQSPDRDVKKEVLRAWMVSGDRTRLFSTAKQERDPKLRREAIRQLGVMGSGDELAELYRSEQDREVKVEIIRALFVGGRTEKLSELAQTEPDVSLRSTAVRQLGLFPRERTGNQLVAIYRADKAEDVRDAALDGLFVQNNDTALIGLARQETDRVMKRRIIEKLSLINTKEAADYFSQILDQ